MSARAAAEEVLAALLAAGASVMIEGGRLVVTAPPGVLTRDRREELARCRSELRAMVASRWRAREDCVAAVPCRRMAPCAHPRAGRPCQVPATCCLCKAPMPPGHRYLCRDCGAGSEHLARERRGQGGRG